MDKALSFMLPSEASIAKETEEYGCEFRCEPLKMRCIGADQMRNFIAWIQTVIHSLCDKHSAELLNKLHGEVAHAHSDSVVEKTAHFLFTHLTAREALGEAESVLMALLQHLDEMPESAKLKSKLCRYLAKLYTLQRAKCRRQTLNKHRFPGYLDALHRLKLCFSSKLFLFFANLETYKCLCVKVNWLSCALEKVPLDIEAVTAWYYIGKFHMAVRSFEEAEKVLKMVLPLLQSADPVFTTKIYLRLGRIYEKTYREEEAEELYSCATDASMHIRLGDIYFMREAFEQSEMEYSKAMSLLSSANSSLEDRADAILRQAVMHKRGGRYQQSYEAVLLASDLLKSCLPSSRVASLEGSLKSIWIYFPSDLFYKLESRRCSSAKQLAQSLVAFTEVCEDEAKSMLLTALADEKTLLPDSLERAELICCLARVTCTEEAFAYYWSATSILIQHSDQSHNLLKLVKQMTHRTIYSAKFVQARNVIEAALRYSQADSIEHLELLKLAAKHLKSSDEQIEAATLVRAAYDIAKRLPSEIIAQNETCKELCNRYEYNEMYEEEEKLLLEHLQLRPESGLFWFKLFEFYQCHGRDSDQEETFRKAIPILSESKGNGAFILMLFSQYGSFHMRMNHIVEAEKWYREAVSAVREWTADINIALNEPSKGCIWSEWAMVMRFFAAQNLCDEIEASLQPTIVKARTHGYKALLKLLDMNSARQSYAGAREYFREMATASAYIKESREKLVYAHVCLGQECLPEIFMRGTVFSNYFSYTILARTHIKEGKLAEAQESLEQALLTYLTYFDKWWEFSRNRPIRVKIKELRTNEYAMLAREVARYCAHDPVYRQLCLQLIINIPTLKADYYVAWEQGFKLENPLKDISCPYKLLFDQEPSAFASQEVIDVQWDNYITSRSPSFIANAYTRFARSCEYHQQTDKAESNFTTALALFRNIHPTFRQTREAFRQLAKFYKRKGQLKEAEAVLSELFDVLAPINPLHNRTSRAAMALARVHQKLKQFATAETLLMRALEVDQRELFTYVKGLLRLCTLYVDMGRFREAERCLLLCLVWLKSINPTYMKSSQVLEPLNRMKKFDKAEMIATKFARIFKRQIRDYFISYN